MENRRSPPVVLVTDDQFIVRIDTAEALMDEGFSVVAAADADEALSILRTRTDVSVLVTDVKMPGKMDGCTLADIVRKRWPAIGIVINSGKGRPPGNRVPDGVPFLSRPLTAKQLLGTVRTVLRERKRQAGAAAQSGAPGLPTITGPITDPGTTRGDQPVASPEKD